MARRTARKSRKRRRRSRRSRRRRGGGPGVAANASEVNFNEKPVDVADEAPVEEAPAEAQEGGKRKRRRRKGRKSKRGGGCGLTEEQTGGKRRKTKKKGGKRKLNAYFKAMLAAKKSKAASFKYKGATYKGRKHKRLGMIYSKA
jgi:hypothetical protein